MRKVLIVVLTCLMNLGLIGQQAPPQGINYQATLYVPSTKPLPGTNGLTQVPANKSSVEVVFTIEEGMNGPVVFQENHQDTTDELGLLELIIGQGSPTVSSFNQIDWSLGDLYLRVSITILTTNTTINSYQKLWSVPYSLYSGRSNTTGYSDSSGHSNTSDTSLYSHNSGHSNTSDTSLYSHNSGHSNTSDTSLYSHNSGHSNTSDTSLYSHNSGHSNTSDTSLYSHNSGHAQVADTALNAWRLTGNSGTTPNTNFIGTIDNQDWVIKTNNIERMRVMANGNVGIGTIIPSEKLELNNGGIRINGMYGIGFNDESFGNNTPNGLEGAKIYFDNTITNNPNTDYLVIEKKDGSTVNPDGGIVFANRGNNGIRTPTMLIDGLGKVGIGTTNPQSNLEVIGVSRFGNGGQLGLELSFDNGSLLSPLVNLSTSSGGLIKAPFQGNLIFQIRGNQIDDGLFVVTDIDLNGTPDAVPFKVLANGNVGVGDVKPQRNLHIKDVMRLEPRATVPTNPSKGDIYFDSVINKLRVFDGTSWQNCW